MKTRLRQALLPPAITRVAAAASMLAAVAVVPAGTARASLIGDTISGVLEAPSAFPGDNLWDGIGGATTATPTAVVVGAGAEFSTFSDLFLADFGANSLSIGIRNLSRAVDDFGASQVYDFTGLDLPGGILNVLLTNSDFDGVTFSFGDHSIHVEIPNQGIVPGLSTVSFQIVADNLAQDVPEPGTLALFGLGFSSLALARRRRG